MSRSRLKWYAHIPARLSPTLAGRFSRQRQEAPEMERILYLALTVAVVAAVIYLLLSLAGAV